MRFSLLRKEGKAEEYMVKIMYGDEHSRLYVLDGISL